MEESAQTLDVAWAPCGTGSADRVCTGGSREKTEGVPESGPSVFELQLGASETGCKNVFITTEYER